MEPARIRRLLSVDGVVAGDALVGALARIEDARDVRQRYLAWLRSTGSDAGASAAARLDRALDERATRIPADVAERLLGDHESIGALITITLEKCLAHDLRERGDARAAALRGLADWVAEIVQSVPDADLLAAQLALLAHPKPGALRYFARIWPKADSLAEARARYLARLADVAPIPTFASVVGYAHVAALGSPEERRALVDWDAELAAQERSPIGGQLLALRCGVRISLSPDVPDPARCFSALELLGRVRTEPWSTDDDVDALGAAEAPPVARTVASVFFPGVDGALRLVARAALGRDTPSEEAWPPRVGAELEPERAEVVGALRPSLVPLLLAPESTDDDAARLMRLARSAVAWPLVRARLADVDAARDDGARVESWGRAVHAAALARWADGIATLVTTLTGDGERAARSFRLIAARWLLTGPVEPTPTGRRRRPDEIAPPDEGPWNAFSLDLVASPRDCALLRLVIPWAPADVTTWALNEWDVGCGLVELLARGAGLDAKGRSGLVWVHHLLFGEQAGRSLGAFKKGVSVAGLVPWSLAEVDEAVVGCRPSGIPTSTWRRQASRRAGGLPDRPWTAKDTWSGGARNLGWIRRIFDAEHARRGA